MSNRKHVVIIGAGSAGISVAARLRKLSSPPDVTIVDPSEFHYYQPLLTLVGGGVFPKERTRRRQADYIPKGVEWVKESVASMDPADNSVKTESGKTISYDYLVVAPGIQLDWHKIPGLKESIGSNGVCSNYAPDQAGYTWETLKNLKGGTALFTQPAGAIKCGGAPQKIMYLSADHLRRKGLLDSTEIHIFTPGTAVFGVEIFRIALLKVIERYGIDFHLFNELIEVRGEKKEAVVRVKNADGEVVEERTYSFDMLHVTPPQSAPDFIKSSPVANADGWVDVNHQTLQHNRFDNVFSLGDAAGTPNAKTGAAVRMQAPIVVHHLRQMMESGMINDEKPYNGYSSCPLVTGYGKLILAEFDYKNEPAPSFPFNTAKERYSMYLMKVHLLPRMYWHGMLRGRV